MKPSKFVPYYERLLGRPLEPDELAAVEHARGNSVGKRDAVKLMRAALLELVPSAHAGYRTSIKPSCPQTMRTHSTLAR